MLVVQRVSKTEMQCDIAGNAEDVAAEFASLCAAMCVKYPTIYEHSQRYFDAYKKMWEGGSWDDTRKDTK